MSATHPEARPTLPMSVEEKHEISTLTRTVAELASSVRVLSDNQGRLEKIVTQLATKTELSWDKIGQLVLIVLAIVGPCGGILGLLMGNRVAPLERDASVAATERAADRSTLRDVDERTDKLEHQRAADHDDFVRTNTAQDIYLALLWRQEFHSDPPTVPLTK